MGTRYLVFALSFFFTIVGPAAAQKTQKVIDVPKMFSKHLERMYPKLGVENRTAAAAMAHEMVSGNGRSTTDNVSG